MTLPENLIKKGEEDLQEAIKSTSSITVTAADLSGTGAKVESFRFMKNVKCISKRHGLDFRSPIVALDRNLLDRSDYKITVGDTQKTYTGTSVTSKRESESKSEEIIDLEREARKKAIKDLVSKMEKASGLYVTDIGEDGAHNWYLHDKKTVEESYVIIQVNDAGILFSADGGKNYNGVSWDGKAILEKIYTIGLDATHIDAGTLDADIVKIKNLHLKDISDTTGTTLDATLDGITSEVSKKVGDSEIISKINQSAEEVSINADKIKFEGSTSFSSAIESNSTVSGLSKSLSETTKSVSNLKQTADNISSEVSKKVGDDEIISKINQSAEEVSINANKINFTGSATFTNAVNANSTVSEASKNASSALTAANSANDTLNSWSYGSDMTEIDGGAIKANTITADKIAIGDYTNYATVNENDASTILSEQAIWTDDSYGRWIEGTDKTSGLRYLYVSNRFCINSFKDDDILRFDFKIWVSTAQTVWCGIWFYNVAGTYINGYWDEFKVPAGGDFRKFQRNVKISSVPENAKYYALIFEFTKYGADSRNCIQKVTINRVSGYFQIGDGYINSTGEFQIGPMASINNNTDVEFKKAIFVDYGLEIFAGNDGGTPYFDFHHGATGASDAKYDYTARIQNTQESWIDFYGLRENNSSATSNPCTVQAGQFRGTFAQDSDRRLKMNIENLDEEKAVESLMKYRPVSYQYINGVDTNVHHGLIAQEVQKIADWGLVDDRGKYLAINYVELIADLIKVVQRHEKILKERDKT